MSKPNERFSPFAKQCFVTTGVCSNVIGIGCIVGFPGVLLPQLHVPGSAIKPSKEMESWIASVLAISMFFGNFMTPPIMDRLGRRIAHFSVTLPILTGWLATIFATNSEALLAGRILQGIGLGMMQPLRCALLGEYASPRHRGGFLATIALAQGFGILLVHTLGSYLSFQHTAAISLSFSLISLVITTYSPESPSWLATVGQYDKCREVFLWLRGKDETPELEKMIEASKQRTNDKKRFKDVLNVAQKKEFYKPVFLMFAVYIMMNFSGPILFATYSTVVLQLLMGPEIDAPFWMVAFDVQRLIFNTGAVYVINRTSRRTMMFATGALCAGSHLAQSGYIFAKSNQYLPFDSLWIPGILVSLQVLSFAVGMIPLPNVIAGEVYPLQYRSLAGCVSVVASSASIFLVLKTFPALIFSVGLQGVYLLHSGVISAGLVVVWFLLPETKGKTLQEIEECFRGKPFELEGGKELETLNRTEEEKMLDKC
ncbi:facilitated trehalose transporter Tret1-like isoform X2 [Leguminivora glycinivorella]|uniref:facilitated trehalose transporter Tret1-like isoform X2 n=1 Tax=Leguminivora glycinivorella TaxID=1035111 RepID=UPI00200D3369|nr:facilitated trehalose transporter Tret1-like isoform X2 [Leguminivora glycinivorella]